MNPVYKRAAVLAVKIVSLAVGAILFTFTVGMTLRLAFSIVQCLAWALDRIAVLGDRVVDALDNALRYTYRKTVAAWLDKAENAAHELTELGESVKPKEPK